MFPFNRNRRLRNKESLRNLIRETSLHPHDFIAPLFVVEGSNIKEEISSMPNYFRLSLDNIKKEINELWSMGVQAVLVFVKVPEKLKDNSGTEAMNSDGLMQRAIKEIKNSVPEISVITDVALDPYSIYGHDGIVKENKILNDETNEILSKMASQRPAVRRHQRWLSPLEIQKFPMTSPGRKIALLAEKHFS